MKKGLVYKMIFGKQRSDDFTSDNLPATRRQQFFVLFKSRFGILFRANLLCAPFWILLLVWDMLAVGYVDTFTQNMTVAEKFSYLINLTLLRYGTDAILLALASIGLAGVFYVARKLCWGQPVKVGHDFIDGIKKSWKQFFLIGLILGIFVALTEYLISVCSLTMSEDNSFFWTTAICLCYVARVIALIVATFSYAQASLYNVSTSKLLLNSMALTFKKLFSSFGVLCVTAAPMIVCWFLPWGLAKLIILCLVLTVGTCYVVFAQTEFCLYVFDRYINVKEYPDFVGMGLKDGKSFLEVTDPSYIADDEEESVDDNRTEKE